MHSKDEKDVKELGLIARERGALVRRGAELRIKKLRITWGQCWNGKKIVDYHGYFISAMPPPFSIRES